MRLSPPARTFVTRLLILALIVVALDGAITWYAIDQGADVVAGIEARDGLVALDDSELGMRHEAEITRAVGDDRSHIRLGRVLWIPAVLMAIAVGGFSPRADDALRSSLVMTVAVTLAIWTAPRIVYSTELRALETALG